MDPLFGQRCRPPRGPPRRTQAGVLSTAPPAKCRAAVKQSLTEALTVKKAELYGRGPCADDPQARCFDMNRSTIASAVGLPPMPFQNRPTFQQTVELTHKLPR